MIIVGTLLLAGIAHSQDLSLEEEVVVFDSQADKGASHKLRRKIDAKELSSINLSNTEDALSYQPNLIVRKRYIGDINSTMGMRGSNMYQTTRSMVFADGLPLHYFLQTQFSGAPRWSLVSPSEIASLRVIYGPFSAEYSGNAMGGVIEIETRRPQKQEINIALSAYRQNPSTKRDSNSHPGLQGALSYENLYGALGIYFSLLHLENESQVLTFSGGQAEETTAGDAVTGANISRDSLGAPVVFYGDQGPEKTISDLAKLKFLFDAENFRSQLTFGYEGRTRKQESPSSYLRDANGEIFWRGEASLEGFAFTVDPREFYLRDQNRESLIVGINMNGPVYGKAWTFDINLSRFDIIEDEDLESLGTFDDPDFDGAAILTDLGGSNWTTANIKLRRDGVLFGKDVDLSLGAYYDQYQFESQRFDSNFQSGEKLASLGGAAGTTSTSAVFFQAKWAVADGVTLGTGLRLEYWKSRDDMPVTQSKALTRKATRSSPKFSLGYRISPRWEVEYAFALAYRFPIVEELFENKRATSGTVLANANLQPEDGRHHNLLLQRKSDTSLTSISLFYENVRDVIFNQTQLTPLVRTFLPIDEVDTLGLELSFEQDNIFDLPLRVSLNSTYLHTEVLRNAANSNMEGNVFPRMPKLRVNLLGGYKFYNDALVASAGIRYQSNSFGRIDNRDRENNVFGAHDDFTFVNLKFDYHASENIKLSVGVDNLTNDLAYVFSPWPGRTFFSELRVKF